MRAKSIVGIALAGLGLVAALGLSSCTLSASSITSPRYALVYGVSTYYSSVAEGAYITGTVNGITYAYYNLKYSDNDAEDMATLMTKQGWDVTSRVKGSGDTTTYLPTKAQMITDLSELASKISSDSTVLFYFSGHGDTESGVSYIVPYLGITDVTSDPSITLSNCISPSDLSSMLSVLPTKNIIVVFDTCYSGGFVSSGSAIDSSPSSYADMESYSAFSSAISDFGSLLVANAAASGAKAPIVISAAGSNESSYDGSGNGVFTGYLLDAATDGDTNGDGYISTTEAYEYTARKIKAWDIANSYSYYPFLPHISGGNRDLVLFTK